MNRKIIGAVLGLAIAIAAIVFILSYQPEASPPPVGPSPHFEVIGIVASVVDGDTISVSPIWVDESIEGVTVGRNERVRFSGGIDAPEVGQTGGEEATNFVKGLCPPRTGVYLDLDNLATYGAGPYRDIYGRLLAVIYVKIDDNWINVNAELLRWGLEAYPQHDWLRYIHFSSEFDPYEWLAENYPYVRR